MDGVVRMVGVVRVITGQGGQFGQVMGMLGSSSQHKGRVPIIKMEI